MRTWTVDEANAALAHVTELVKVIRAAASRHPSGNGQAKPSSNGQRNTDREVRDALAELERDGIVVRDAQRGLVDFPALAPSGRRYWLCWVVGEPEVAWWHWPEDGFAGRQPLAIPPA